MTNFSLDLTQVSAPKKQKIDGCGQAAVLTKEEIDKLLSVMSNRWRTVFALCYLMGARVSEVLTLETTDIKDTVILLRPSKTKTKSTKQVQITDSIRQVLENYTAMPESGYLFSKGRRGVKKQGHLTRSSAHNALKKAAEECGIEGVSTHSFRRSFATHLTDMGLPMSQVKDLLGHKDITTTARYVG